MRDYARKELESTRPGLIGPRRALASFCLRHLHEDDEKSIEDFVVPGLTFGTLIDALLLARDHAEELAKIYDDEG